MIEIVLFGALGIVFGLGTVLMIFQFDRTWIKALSFASGASMLAGVLVGFSEAFNISKENRIEAFTAFVILWIVSVIILLPILLKILKKQKSKYKVHSWEVLFGDKKTLDDYYTLKKDEIARSLELEYNMDKIRSERDSLEKSRQKYLIEMAELNKVREAIEDAIDKKHFLVIPEVYKYPVTNRFFELLPRYLQSISEFYHHVHSFTDDFIDKIEKHPNIGNREKLIRTYLNGMCLYIGQTLFDWRDVRVHFRKYVPATTCYEKYVAAYKTGQEYKEEMTPIPANEGLILQATKLKRSLVYSANKDACYNTGSAHIWKDYTTMVFEKLNFGDQPILSLGISVKHDVDHRDILYFLSFIQIEQFIQENLMRVDEHLSIVETLTEEAA